VKFEFELNSNSNSNLNLFSTICKALVSNMGCIPPFPFLGEPPAQLAQQADRTGQPTSRRPLLMPPLTG
jgi:hypothetical protein